MLYILASDGINLTLKYYNDEQKHNYGTRKNFLKELN